MLGKREKYTPDPSRLDNSCPLPLVELMLRSNPLPFRTGAAHNMFFCSLPGIPDCTASAKTHNQEIFAAGALQIHC